MKLKNYYILFWLLALCFNNQVSSQTFYDIVDQIEQDKGASLLQYKLDSLLDTSKNSEIYLKMSHDFSVKFYKKKDYEAAIKYASKEVKHFENEGIKNEKYVRALFQLGYFYELTAQFDNAINNYNKVILTDPNSLKAIQSYSKLGSCYFKLGNYYQAETYYLKAISESQKNNNLGLIASHSLSLAMIYRTLDNETSREKELAILNKVLEIDKIEPLSNRRLSVFLNSMANYYNSDKTFDFDKAEFYYKKLVENSIINADYSVTGMAYGNLGNLHLREESDSTGYYLEKSLDYPLPESDRSKVFRNFASYQLQKNDKDGALQYLNHAIKINYQNQEINLEHPNLTDLKDTDELTGVIAALSQKAEILLEMNEELKNLSLVEQAFRNLQTADSLIDHLKSSNREENSRLYWRKEASKVYHNAVYCSYLLNNHELALTYSEKNKAILLTEDIIKNSFKLPQSVKNRERFLRYKLREYENNLENNTDTTLIQFYSKALLNQKLAVKKHDDSIQKAYPALSQKIEDLKILSLQEIQGNLKKNEVVISYVWNKEVLFKDHLMCLIITQENVKLLEIEHASELSNELTIFLQAIVKPFQTKEDITAYNKHAHTVYNKLFPTLEIQELLKGKIITIIADGQLQNIPFEALITKLKPSSYLIEESQINYTYSLSFSNKNNALQRSAAQNLISFSPSNFNKIGLPKLYDTNKEVYSIHKFIKSDIFIDSLATKEAFLSQFDKFKIVHLATHASSGVDPFLAFYDSKLSIEELYVLNNNAQLVFLSACDTSVGAIAQGEGALTIARGFFNTGAQSVVASLWKTSDKSTAFIVEEFYKNIEDEKGVSTALHLAKLKYLKNHNLSEVSPYYWSSLIALGDNKNIELEDSLSYGWLLFLIALITCILLLLWKLKISSKQ
ncbi:MAG: CHAT domain-containing protein [Nonlabens sp.]|uniref:CHAT domain-containing protein n=1 Tax=Nonlabens sp. TaxID=1888209 RepID=UPI003EF8F10C